MKIISEKISKHHAPGRGPFRGKVHCETEEAAVRLRGSPVSLELSADYDGRRFFVRLDWIELDRLLRLAQQKQIAG